MRSIHNFAVKSSAKSLLFLSLLASTQASIATETKQENQTFTALQEEILWLQEETYVTTATKTLENIKKSGATISVITATDLKNMGARNLMDALKRLPGLGININNIGLPVVEVRGVKTDFSEKVLFLINGHSANNNLINGGATWTYGSFQIDEIKQVEIVRGPGSALYGANAFVAVINIITKKSKDVDGTKLTAGVGDNKTTKVNIQTGQQIGEVGFAINANFFDTDGYREFVASDVWANSGKSNDWNKRYDLGFNINVSNYALQGKYIKRNAGPYIGTGNALNDESEQQYTEFFLELAYKRMLFESLSFNNKFYYNNFKADNFWEVFSENFSDALPAPQPSYPDGMLGRSPATVERMGAEFIFEYVKEKHKFLFGLMTEHQTIFDIGFEANFNPTTPPPSLPAPLGSLQDIYDTWPWISSEHRDISALFFQDIYDVNSDLRLILGARYDHYSDFGSSFNPRSSLSWEFTKNYNLVASYGSAFRAPTFGEQHNKNNPFVVGNPDVEPEEIETFELGVNGDISKRMHFGVTLFHNNINDLISGTDNPNPPGPKISDNVDKIKVNGVEMELRSRLRDGSTVNLNYTYQYAIDDLTGQRVSEVPMHKANASINNRHSQYLSSYLGLLHRGALNSSSGEIKDHITVDIALNLKSPINNFEIKASIYNLFNQKYVDAAPAAIASNFPKPSRNLMVEVSYKL